MLASTASIHRIIALLLVIAISTRPTEGFQCLDQLAFKRTEHPYEPSMAWGHIHPPYPTNAHWTNLVLEQGNQSAFPLPYYIRNSDSDISITYSEPRCNQDSCTTSLEPELQISATELRDHVSIRHIAHHDSLSISSQWRVVRTDTNSIQVFDVILQSVCVEDLPDGKFCDDVNTGKKKLINHYKDLASRRVRNRHKDNDHRPGPIHGIPNNLMTAHLVYGSPYVTIKYGLFTPDISSKMGIAYINGNPPKKNVDYAGDKLTLTLRNGRQYVVYMLHPGLVFRWTSDRHLVSSSTYRGTLRIAAIPLGDLDHSYEHLLDQHVSPYAIGGKISFNFSNEGTHEIIDWVYEGSSNSSNLLMLTLPHHQKSIVSDSSLIETPISTIKGKMQGMLGRSWTLFNALVKVDFMSANSISPGRVNTIAKSVRDDLLQAPDNPSDTYSFGNVAARYARLSLIADAVEDTDSRDKYLQLLETMLNPWLEPSSTPFLYDETWGGVVTVNSLLSKSNEYGQGYYNDHHYHWGYIIYAAAVMGHFKPDWIPAHKPAVDLLVRDIATSSTDDPCFPFARHKDLFLGHSWASGLFEFADGKNQESTSEAVNAYYAVFLWGLAIQDSALSNWGQFLLSTEIQSAQTYWQIQPSDGIYDQNFAINACVGILWSSKVDYATWFGKNVEYIHEIQMLPFTPVSSALIPYNWVLIEYVVLRRALDRVYPPLEEIWKSFIVITESFINRDDAWKKAQSLTAFHMGNSKSNTLYTIATN